MMKKCKRCDAVLELNEFPVNVRNKDGRDVKCKLCCAAITRAWRKANPVVARASERRWLERNPERAKKNRDAAAKRFGKAHPELVLFYAKRWKDANKSRVKEYSKKWAKNNAEKCACKSSARRAATFRAMPPWLSAEDRAAIAEKFVEARCLSRETGVKYHVDHIVPLKAKTACGLHVHWNLQVIPATVNQRKWNKIEGATDAQNT
jgi:hypothetical protein